MKQLIGLYRETEFSPGKHKSNDARLLELVADRLRESNLKVDLLPIEKAADRMSGAELVFSMCQGKKSLEALTVWESRGVAVINRPQAAMNTYRDRLSGLMLASKIPFPETQLVQTTNRSPSMAADGGVWLKRGDVHASTAADVQWIDSEHALETGFADFAARGINTAAIQAHKAGDEIKFYGVGDGFFHWFYPVEPRGYSFDVHALARLGAKSARATGLDIFGGDIIVSPSGELTVIDLNDWPSFAPCLGPASEAIAQFIKTRVNHG